MYGRLRSLVHRINKLKEEFVHGQQHMWSLCLREGETEDASLARHGVTPTPHDLIIFLQDYTGAGYCAQCQPAAGVEGTRLL